MAFVEIDGFNIVVLQGSTHEGVRFIREESIHRLIVHVPSSQLYFNSVHLQTSKMNPGPLRHCTSVGLSLVSVIYQMGTQISSTVSLHRPKGSSQGRRGPSLVLV